MTLLEPGTQNADCATQPSINIEDDDGPTPKEEIQTDDRDQARPAERDDDETHEDVPEADLEVKPLRRSQRICRPPTRYQDFIRL